MNMKSFRNVSIMSLLISLMVIFLIAVIGACSYKKRVEIMTSDWPSAIKPPEQILFLPGYSPTTFLIFDGFDESVEVAVYKRSVDSLQQTVDERIKSMKDIAGRDLDIMDQSKVGGGESAFKVKTRLKEGLFKFSYLGVYWQDLKDDWRLELTYSYSSGGKGSYAVFHDVIAHFQHNLESSNNQPPENWSPRHIGHGVLMLPNRLLRKSPFRVYNTDQDSEWSIDAIVLSSERVSKTLVIPSEQETPMFRNERESNLPNGLAGQMSVWSVVDAGMGVLSKRVVRATVLVDGDIQIVLRGIGPAEGVSKLERELNILLGQLK
jgi:hypothetical protein